jgi:hypothetical protein
MALKRWQNYINIFRFQNIFILIHKKSYFFDKYQFCVRTRSRCHKKKVSLHAENKT